MAALIQFKFGHGILIIIIAVDCGSLDSPANGSISLSATTFLSLAEYSCDLGYILIGEESRQCQANRTWSGEDPICEGK